jgi:glutamate-ammonia-ligase adenylyltransferase
MNGGESPLEDWLALSGERREQLARVLAISDFLAETLVRHPEWLLHLDASGELETAPEAESLGEWLAERLESAENEEAMHAAIRRFRCARMLGIVWRDLTRPPGIDMWATAAAVSRLAETCLEGALGWLETHLASRWGWPQKRRDGTAPGRSGHGQAGCG